MPELQPESFTPCFAASEYFTPEARALCERVAHKSELSDEETIMLALVGAQAALARYWHPGDRSAEEALDRIGRLLDHNDVVTALNRMIGTGTHGVELASARSRG